MIDQRPQQALSTMLNTTTPDQHRALIFYYRIAMKGRTPERREVLWRWAERTCNKRMQPLVKELHGIVSKISSDLERELAK